MKSQSKKDQQRKDGTLIGVLFIAAWLLYSFLTAPVCDEICQIAERSRINRENLAEKLDR